MNRHPFISTLTILVIMLSAAVRVFPGNDILPLGPSKYKLLIEKIEKDQIIDTQTGDTVTIDQLIAKTKNTDVFIIGEAHDNYKCHTFQRDFIRALYKKHPKLIVGFEFFWREDDPLLEQWRNGEISEEDLLKKTGWYKRGGMNYGYTRLIMDVIKENKIKVIGLNVDRSILRTVSRKGYDQLDKKEKALFPTLHIPNPEHRYFIKSIFGIFAAQVPMWFNNIYTAQTCWDVIMAESMRRALAKKEFRGYKGVIIAGSNHVAYKLGIPFRYKKASRRTKTTTIVPILLPPEVKEGEKDDDEAAHPMMRAIASSMEPASLFSRGIADYVFSAPQPLNHFYPVIGVTLKEKDDHLLVTRVSKKSLADKNGLKKGDKITAVDSIGVKTQEQLRTLFSKKNWGDEVSITVTKKIKLEKQENDKTGKKKEKAEKPMMNMKQMKSKKPMTEKKTSEKK